jgi:glutamine synthetase
MFSFDTFNECRMFMEKENIPQFDVKFCDLLGRWHHITLMHSALDERLFKIGVGFDSSSIPRFGNVRHGDMAARPDLSACFLDTTRDQPTLSAIADIVEAGTGTETPLDPRTVLRKALAYLVETGIADSFVCAPELEFYLFEKAGFFNDPYGAWFKLGAPGVGHPANGDLSGAGERLREGTGYMIAGPQDWWFDARAEMASKMADIGLPVRYHHVEVGAAGQQEIELGFSPALNAADGILLGKYIVRSVALNRRIEACFMPKPIADAAGNGLHIHFRLLRNGTNLFAGDGYGGLSKLGKYFLGGVLSHGRALLAILCASTNSYRRLRPGHETPVRFFYSVANREAAVRIPKYSTGRHTRCEFRPGDATMNSYLGISALLMAGLDGIKRKIDPTPLHLGPFDGEPPRISPREHPECFLPRHFGEAINALEDDHDFLFEGGVFTESLIDNYVSYKRDNEMYPLIGTPHPLEFEMYWGI